MILPGDVISRKTTPRTIINLVGAHQHTQSGHLRVAHISPAPLNNKKMVSLKLLILLLVINEIFGNYKNNGIEFTYQQKLLLAEKFVNVKFLVPFPQLNENLGAQIINLTSLLNTSWHKYQFGCDLSNLNTNESGLHFDLLAKHVSGQLQAAKEDLVEMKNELAETIGINEMGQTDSTHKRNKRGLPIIAFGALTAATAGAGIACSLGSIFGMCGESSSNREDIDFALNQLEQNKQEWIEVTTKVNDKFFILGSQMKEVRKTQNQIIETQRKHTTIINDAIKLIKENTRKLMACSQYFYARDQMLQLQTTIVSSLLAINNEIKTYRVATYSYKLNLLNSVMAMVNKVIPMSLLPRSALLGILQKVAFHQVQEADRLTHAIPTQNILTYYETKILTNVIVDPAGLLFKLVIPFASGSTALNLYRATAIPMPNGGSDGYASQYDLESDYIAIVATSLPITYNSKVAT